AGCGSFELQSIEDFCLAHPASSPSAVHQISIDPRGLCRNTPRQTNKTMMKTKRSLLRLGLGLCLVGTSQAIRADEGMWLFNDPPKQLLKQRYDFDATDAWLEHVQKSSVRFNSGGSGEVVSEDGLIMSNHHVGADALQKLS